MNGNFKFEKQIVPVSVELLKKIVNCNTLYPTMCILILYSVKFNANQINLNTLLLVICLYLDSAHPNSSIAKHWSIHLLQSRSISKLI